MLKLITGKVKTQDVDRIDFFPNIESYPHFSSHYWNSVFAVSVFAVIWQNVSTANSEVRLYIQSLVHNKMIGMISITANTQKKQKFQLNGTIHE